MCSVLGGPKQTFSSSDWIKMAFTLSSLEVIPYEGLVLHTSYKEFLAKYSQKNSKLPKINKCYRHKYFCVWHAPLMLLLI